MEAYLVPRLPSKSFNFCLEASMEAILTGENLTRKIIHVKCCYLCLKEEEIVNHLVIHSNEQGNVAPSALDIAFAISSHEAAWAPSTGNKSREIELAKYCRKKKSHAASTTLNSHHERFETAFTSSSCCFRLHITNHITTQSAEGEISLKNISWVIQTALNAKDNVITAEAAAAATLRLTLVPNTNLSLKAAASVRLSLALSRPSKSAGETMQLKHPLTVQLSQMTPKTAGFQHAVPPSAGYR
nr:hypothetical protein Iba_chr02bCG19360 [Ipomoea batatas]